MSCLFRSLSTFVDGESEQSLRSKIVDYLARNPELQDGMTAQNAVEWEVDGQSFATYLGRMRRGYTWGGAIEIKAFCDMHKAKVCVHVRRGRHIGPPAIEFLPQTEEVDFVVRIVWTGNHFEPLRCDRV